MHDPRITKLARILVHYSVALKPGQIVLINGDPIAMPLLEAIYEQALLAGAHPIVKCAPDTMKEIFLRTASRDQLQHVNPLALNEMKTIDAYIGLWADTNTKALSRIDPARQSLASAARKPILKTMMARAAKGQLHWVGTQYPTPASAQDAEMSLRDYEDFVFTAGYLHLDDPVKQWKKIAKAQQKVVDYLNGKHTVRFQAANGTDLTVNVEGMTWINCCGRENFPDGEVFTGPNLRAADGGVNGIVHYSFPAVHHGREVQDITLRFQHGKVVEASASKNQDFLLTMLDQDPGARRVGEVALGTNYQVQQFSRNTLFDEKIGGTFHLAVGAGYPETGNANESGLHWDMVCDLRPGGTITVDGKTISRDGKFLFKGWPGND